MITTLRNYIGDRVFYVNLDSEPLRAKKIEEAFKYFEINVTRIPAVAWKPLLNGLNIGTKAENPHAHQVLSEKSLDMAFYGFLTQVSNSKEPMAWFEDDAVFCKGFKSKWWTHKFDMPDDLDVLYLGAFYIEDKPHNVDRDVSLVEWERLGWLASKGLQRVRHALGTHAVIFTPQGAKKVLNNWDWNKVCDRNLHHMAFNKQIIAYRIAEPAAHPPQYPPMNGVFWVATQIGESSISSHAPQETFARWQNRFADPFETLTERGFGLGQLDWQDKDRFVVEDAPATIPRQCPVELSLSRKKQLALSVK